MGFAPLHFPKSLNRESLKEISDQIQIENSIFENTVDAFKSALNDLKNNEIIIVTGSLYLIGEIFRHLKNLPPPPEDGRIDDRI